MSSSKKFIISTQYFNPATNFPYITNTQELEIKYNLKKGDQIPPDAKIEFLKIGEIILFMFEHVECKPESRKIYGEIIHDIQNSIKEKLDYIELTKQEAIEFQNIFIKSKITQPQHNPLVLFIIQEFFKFLKDFENTELEDISKEQISEIKN